MNSLVGFTQRTDSVELLELNKNMSLLDEFLEEGKLDSSILYRKRTIQCYKNLDSFERVVTHYNALYTTAIYVDDLYEAGLALDSSIHIAKRHLDPNSATFFYSTANKGYEELQRSNYSLAIDDLRTAVYGLDSIGEPVAYYYNNIYNLLNAYFNLGASQEGIDLINYFTAKIEQDTSNDYFLERAELLREKAMLLRENADYKQAIDLFFQAIDQNQKVRDKHTRIVNDHRFNMSLAKVYQENDQLDSALILINQSIDEYVSAGRTIGYLAYSDKAKVFFDLKRYDEAIAFFKKSISKYETRKKRNKKVLSTLYSFLAVCFLQTSELDSAKFYMVIADENLGISANTDLNSFSDYKNLSNFNINSVKTLSRKAQIAYALAKSSNDQNLIYESLVSYQQAFDGTRYLFKELKSPASKYKLSENIQTYFSDYLQLLIEKYEQDGDLHTFKSIFQLVEDNKAITLEEHVQNRMAMLEAEVPEAVLEEESNLVSRINTLQRNLHDHQASGSDQAVMNDWNTELVNKKQEYHVFQHKLEQNYPAYFTKRFTIEEADLEQLINNLEPNDCYLNYFFFKDKLLCVYVTPQEQGVHVISNQDDVFQKQCQDYFQQVRTKPESTFKQQDLQRFQQLGFDLFEQLVSQLPSNVDNLIISPASYLYYLPFETIITDIREDVTSFKSLSYLILDYSVEYAYSVDLFIQSRQGRHDDDVIQVASYAPFSASTSVASNRTSRNGTELTELICSKKEIENISKYFDNTMRENEQADLAEFEENLNVDILHLATHATIDDDVNFNKLYLADDYIALQDLEQYNITSDLVVLSACNTGIGAIQSGEGMIDLGKGFRKAGVQSLVTSLWTLDDCSTSDIVDKFYSNIRSMDISATLRVAKLDYLKNSSKVKSHPYYWAGLVFTGNAHVFENTYKTNASSYLMYTLLLLGLVALVRYYLKK